MIPQHIGLRRAGAVCAVVLTWLVCRHGEDMAGLGAARAAWNKSLLSEVAATAYTNLVMQVSLTRRCWITCVM